MEVDVRSHQQGENGYAMHVLVVFRFCSFFVELILGKDKKKGNWPGIGIWMYLKKERKQEVKNGENFDTIIYQD
jgi:hypothetical protein